MSARPIAADPSPTPAGSSREEPVLSHTGVKTSLRASLSAGAFALLLALLPASASAQTIIVYLANMEIDNSTSAHGVYVRVTNPGIVCGSLAGGPSGVRLRWRDTEDGEARANYEEGFSALLSALVGHLGLVMNVWHDAGANECVIDRITLAAP